MRCSCRDLVKAGDGSAIAEGRVRPPVVVVAQRWGKSTATAGRGDVGTGVRPVAQQGLDEALGFAVGARRVRAIPASPQSSGHPAVSFQGRGRSGRRAACAGAWGTAPPRLVSHGAASFRKEGARRPEFRGLCQRFREQAVPICLRQQAVHGAYLLSAPSLLQRDSSLDLCRDVGVARVDGLILVQEHAHPVVESHVLEHDGEQRLAEGISELDLAPHVP